MSTAFNFTIDDHGRVLDISVTYFLSEPDGASGEAEGMYCATVVERESGKVVQMHSARILHCTCPSDGDEEFSREVFDWGYFTYEDYEREQGLLEALMRHTGTHDTIGSEGRDFDEEIMEALSKWIIEPAADEGNDG